jgi:hypothetical protein
MLKLTSLLLVLTGLAAPAFGMDITRDGETVTLSGRVMGNECVELQKLIAAAKVTMVVLHDSHGGNANAGYCVGNLVRKNGIATTIKGYCESSCSRMWLGGAARTLADKNSWVGLHGNYNDSGGLLRDAPHRLRNWLPVMAPAIDETLMEQWIHLEKNTMMMRFYDEKAAVCSSGHCQPVPGRTATNAGLFATELPEEKLRRLDPDSYKRFGPVAALLRMDGLREMDVISAYAKASGPKALAVSADGGRTTWRAEKSGPAASIAHTLTDCQNAQIAASQIAIRCYLVAIGDDLTMSPDTMRARSFDPGE